MKSYDLQRLTARAGHSLFNVAVTVIVVWYVFLCLTHFFYQRPLWNDEECVFNSVKVFTPGRMFTEKLLNIQVFPRVYLFLIQQFSRPFNYNLLSLRFFSLLCMLTAFLLWLRLAGREMKGRLEYFTFVLSWPASALLIYYSAELKPYSMDVLAGAIFLLFIFRHQGDPASKLPRAKYAAILILLPALGLFSYPAFLLAFIVLYNLIRDSRETKPARKYLAVYSCALVFFLAVSYVFDMRFRHVTGVTEGFGDYFISFASPGDFFKTFQEGTVNLFVKWLVVRPRIIKKISTFFMVFGLLYMFWGFFKNIGKDGYYLRSLKTIALALFIELVIMGALKKYPFTVPRTSLFFCPIVLFLTIKGIGQLRHISRYLYGAVHAAYLIFLVYLIIGLSRVVLAGDMGFEPMIF